MDLESRDTKREKEKKEFNKHSDLISSAWGKQAKIKREFKWIQMKDNLNPLSDTETPLRLSLGPLSLIRIQKHHLIKS